MDIKKVLADGEEVVYRPKLHWFSYLCCSDIIKNLTTTMFLSNMRFYYRHGWMRRHTHEMVLAKIETIDVKETFWSRLFGYGRIYLSGTGAGEMCIHWVKKPFELQRQIRSVNARVNAVGN